MYLKEQICITPVINLSYTALTLQGVNLNFNDLVILHIERPFPARRNSFIDRRKYKLKKTRSASFITLYKLPQRV